MTRSGNNRSTFSSRSTAVLVKIPHFPVYAHPCDVRCCYVNGPMRKRDCYEMAVSFQQVGKFCVCLTVDNGAVEDVDRFRIILGSEREAHAACEEIMRYVNKVIKQEQESDTVVPGDEWKHGFKTEDDDDDSPA